MIAPKYKLEFAATNVSVEAIQDLWRQSQAKLRHYKKFGDVSAVQAQKTTPVVTIIDGVEETKNVANPGDWIVTGAKGEKYVIKDETFRKRYKPSSKHGVYSPIGEAYAFEYKGELGKSINFPAPWGEMMLMNVGDFLASPSKEVNKDIYRIEREAFISTYR